MLFLRGLTITGNNLSVDILASDKDIRPSFACPFYAVLNNIFIKLVVSNFSFFLMSTLTTYISEDIDILLDL